MKLHYIYLISFVLFVSTVSSQDPNDHDEEAAKKFMEELNGQFSTECNKEMVARWDYITDVEGEGKETAANAAAVNFLTFKGESAKKCKEFEYETFEDNDLIRKFRFLSKQGAGALEGDDIKRYKELQANMETTYSTAKICDFNNQEKCDLNLEPDIEQIMASSTDWDELKYAWEQWRDQSGKKMRKDFVEFVQLSNKAADLDGFADTGEYWLNAYTVTEREGDLLNQKGFQDMIENVWNEVSEKLYKKLHAYVRMKLSETYKDKIDRKAPLPAHILGNMWAQDWTSIGHLVRPFPEFPSFDVTESMVDQKWNIDRMFEEADKFFQSLGLEKMNDNFWKKSVRDQEEWGRAMVCHASAEDFCMGEDWRIKMCTDIDMTDLVTVHHEMGHIQYFMEYKDLPYVFREAANPGFHEAIGDLIALSVSTPMHMENVLHLTPSKQLSEEEKQRMLKFNISTRANHDYTDAQKQDLNFLMRMALEKIAFLPFGYLIDKYRWQVFNGEVTEETLNEGWWNLRENLQGVLPPDGKPRSEENFDPGAKYHVPANVPYIRYFVSFIAQFQFHKHLCDTIGDNGLLHVCDIYNQKAAGDKLKSALQEGYSKPWPEVLNELGGSPYLDPSAIIQYFKPLMDFIDTELEAADECIGWGEMYKVQDAAQKAKEALEKMNSEIRVSEQKAIEAQWEFYNDMNKDNENLMIEANAEFSKTYKTEWEKAVKPYLENYESFPEEFSDVKRQIQLQKYFPTLSENEENELDKTVASMTEKYGKNICKADKRGCEDTQKDGISIDELEEVFAKSEDLEALDYYWRKWRDATGKEMKEEYQRYVSLMNTAAKGAGLENAESLWLQPYILDNDDDEEGFKKKLLDIWTELKDFYKHLYGFVRFKLHQNPKYEKEIGVSKQDHLPAHALGNMWAQSWENIYEKVKPFSEEEAAIPDISDTLKDKITKPIDMVDLVEESFGNIGLENVTKDFREHSTLEDSDDKNVMCHASAWDFLDEGPKDDRRYRVKMCLDYNQADFIVLHHEMGHTQYQMAYSPESESETNKPVIFRDGANPGFHEAIGDTIALSVLTPEYLKSIEDKLNSNNENPLNKKGFGALIAAKNTKAEEKQRINFLMKTALSKVAFLPYAYILDEWRWDVFAGRVAPEDYNRHWWEKRVRIQGIRPPSDRSVEDDFDIGAKNHVGTDTPYIRYFVAAILQFQFHKSLCADGGQLENGNLLSDCNIFKIEKDSPALMNLRELLKKGASEPWKDQLKAFTGNEELSAEPILEYFKPLIQYLEEQKTANNINIDWDEDEGASDAYLTEKIPAIVPIVVGCVLGAMIIIVIIAYFVGSSRQKKNRKKEELDKVEMS